MPFAQSLQTRLGLTTKLMMTIVVTPLGCAQTHMRLRKKCRSLEPW
jgi:hypothetical protein